MINLVSTRRDLGNIDVAVLCGGMGTRLQGIIPPDQPKCLVDIHGKPCLELVLNHLVKHGATRIILCTGHLSDKIEAWAAGYDKCEIVISKAEPLGVLYAMKLAREHFRTKYHLFVNGDTVTDADFANFLLRFHRRHNGYRKFGILMGKTVGDPKYRHCAYIMNGPAFDLFPHHSKHFRRVADKLDCSKNQYVYPDAHFIDIGTPEGLQQARMYLQVA